MPQEPLVPLVEEATIGALHRSSRNLRELRPVNLLQGVLQCRSIERVEDRLLDPHSVVRSDAKQVGVKRPVMDLAQCEPVTDRGAPTFGVRLDMRRVEQLLEWKSADRASSLVRMDDSCPKDRLMKPALGGGEVVPPLDLLIETDPDSTNNL